MMSTKSDKELEKLAINFKLIKGIGRLFGKGEHVAKVVADTAKATTKATKDVASLAAGGFKDMGFLAVNGPKNLAVKSFKDTKNAIEGTKGKATTIYNNIKKDFVAGKKVERLKNTDAAKEYFAKNTRTPKSAVTVKPEITNDLTRKINAKLGNPEIKVPNVKPAEGIAFESPTQKINAKLNKEVKAEVPKTKSAEPKIKTETKGPTKKTGEPKVNKETGINEPMGKSVKEMYKKFHSNVKKSEGWKDYFNAVKNNPVAAGTETAAITGAGYAGYSLLKSDKSDKRDKKRN